MWFLLSLVAGLTFAANRLIVRSVFTKHTNPMAFGATHELLAGFMLLPLGLYFFSLPQSPHVWFAFILGILFIFLSDFFSFLALKHIETSLYQIINQLRHVIVLIGAYVLFTEPLSLSKISAIALIMGGIVFALKGKATLRFNKGTVYTLLNTLSIALGLLFIKQASIDVSPLFSAPVALLISGLCIYLIVLFKQDFTKSFLPQTHRKELFLAAGLFGVFEVALFAALAIGEASKVTPVTQSSLIFTIIGGYIFLNERSHMKQKIIGSILIAIGIILLYVL
ncbi:MAG TPA: DMT family transporter [Patescibacteria group bacterium]|nr:DMT family transporter [Patescibacteria group bacterium]